MGENTHTLYLLYCQALLALARLLPVKTSPPLSEKTSKPKVHATIMFWLHVLTSFSDLEFPTEFSNLFLLYWLSSPAERKKYHYSCYSAWNGDQHLEHQRQFWDLNPLTGPSEHGLTCPKSRLTGFTTQREVLSKGPKATILSPQSIQTLLSFGVLLLHTIPSATPEMC